MNSTARTIALVAAFAALTAALAFVSIPVGSAGVPIVLQNAGPLLAGLILGPKKGAYATVLFIAVSMLGLPILAGGRTGAAALAGPTFGFLLGYILSAIVAGLIAKLVYTGSKKTMTLGFVGAGIAGIAADYVCGVLGMMARGISFKASVLALPAFIPGDLLKAVLAGLIAAAVLTALPQFNPASRRTAAATITTHQR